MPQPPRIKSAVYSFYCHVPTAPVPCRGTECDENRQCQCSLTRQTPRAQTNAPAESRRGVVGMEPRGRLGTGRSTIRTRARSVGDGGRADLERTGGGDDVRVRVPELRRVRQRSQQRTSLLPLRVGELGRQDDEVRSNRQVAAA